MTRRRKSPQKSKPASSPAPKAQEPPRGASSRPLFIVAGIAAVLVLAAGVLWQTRIQTTGNAKQPPKTLAFVGSETCIGCHQEAGRLWHDSQHAHAMAHATEETVLGDFDDATFVYGDVTSRFFKKDDKFFVETDGPDGALETFEVKYTFGLEPLQQYLIEFPDGRVQALTIAWDSRRKAEGGQRWSHLYPDEIIAHDDPLHWTKLQQNWNFMCAECHSTGLAKNYDPATDSFDSTWHEISVGCEACHGEGSAHVAWAKSWSPFAEEDKSKGLLARFDERTGVTWTQDAATGQPRRTPRPANLRKEVEMCGRCHARRGQISEAFVPGRSLSDTHTVALIARDLYQPDGQMLDEVYNYGSFLQSKMFAAGVTCSNCHEPHSAKLRSEGDQVCLQCHAGSYAETGHTHHEGESAPGCVACHMPAREFMVIDTRHDHSFRVPRPDLSVTLGVDNACTDCHTDKPAHWAAAIIENWYGPERKGSQSFGPAFHAAWTGKPNAEALLQAVAIDPKTPAFARASALAELMAFPSAETGAAMREGLADPDPLVRLAALDHLQTAQPGHLWPIVGPLLDDPVRGVRVKAALLLAGTPPQSLSPADRARLANAETEFMAAQRLNADRPEGRAVLGRYYLRRGDLAKAEEEYRAALRLSPHFAPAAVNLADLYRYSDRDEEGVAVLHEALALSPNSGDLHHALGLALVRLKKPEEALEELRLAAELEPDRARYAYVYAIGLESQERRTDAINVLKKSLERHQSDRETLLGLINFSSAEGDLTAALRYAEQLAKFEPDNKNLKQMIESLKNRSTEALE